MSAQPSPVYVARAIADALADRARAAYRYHDDWSRLSWAHVPDEHIRAVLDVEDVDETAAPLVARRAWNERRLWCCGGTVGTGKTFAAALWGLDWLRAGRTLYWVSAAAWAGLDLDDQRVLINAATRADGLVIDDVGAGLTQGTGFKSRVEGLIIERADKPTVVLANAHKAEAEAWLGARLLSRMGRDVEFVSGKDRRRRGDEPVGHCGVCYGVCEKSRRWHEAAELIDVLGVSESNRWDQEAGAFVPWLSVGAKLERASRIPGELKRVRRRFRLEQSDVVAAARALEAETEKLASVLAGRVRNLSAAKRLDTERVSEACYGALAKIQSRPTGQQNPTTQLPGIEPMAQFKGLAGLRLMKSLKYQVAPGLDGFDVRRHRAGDPERGRLELVDAGTEAEAWDGLRRHLSAGW